MRPPYSLAPVSTEETREQVPADLASGECLDRIASLHNMKRRDAELDESLRDRLRNERESSKPKPRGSAWDRRVASVLDALGRKAK